MLTLGRVGGSFISSLRMLMVDVDGWVYNVQMLTDAYGGSGRVGWVGRSQKVSFKFLHTLCVYRLCMYLLVYEIKIVTNILMGFKISCQVGGRGQKFQNYSR